MISNDYRIVLWLMVWHYVADFILQTDWQARNKSSNYVALTNHVLVYMFTMGLGAGLIVPPTTVIAWVLITGVLHWCTDWATSRLSKKYFAKQDFHTGFAVVGFDQYIHLVCLLLTTAWALK